MSEFLDLTEAISRLVRPGDTVALEGFTHLIPFAAGHEIVRQRIGDLTLVRMTPDLLFDQMIGAGLATPDTLPPAPPPKAEIKPTAPLAADLHARFDAAIERSKAWAD